MNHISLLFLYIIQQNKINNIDIYINKQNSNVITTTRVSVNTYTKIFTYFGFSSSISNITNIALGRDYINYKSILVRFPVSTIISLYTTELADLPSLEFLSAFCTAIDSEEAAL